MPQYEVFDPNAKAWKPTDATNYAGFQASNFVNAGWKTRDASQPQPQQVEQPTYTPTYNPNNPDEQDKQYDSMMASGQLKTDGTYNTGENTPASAVGGQFIGDTFLPTKINQPEVQRQNGDMTTEEMLNNVASTPFTFSRQQQQIDQMNSLPTYNSQYKDQQKQYLNQINTPYSYDPNNDNALKQAQDEVRGKVLGDMANRGILNSTMTVDRVSQETAKLAPQYEQIAYSRYQQNLNNNLQRADFVNKLDSQDYQRYTDDINKKLKNVEFLNNLDMQDYGLYKDNLDKMFKVISAKSEIDANTIKQQEATLKKAMDRVDMLGYVDNESAIALGIQAGTLSSKAREQAQKRANDLDDAQIKLNSDMRLKQQEYMNTTNKLDYEASLKKIEQDHSDAKLNNLAIVQSQVADLSPDDAIKALQQNSKSIIDATGGENYNKLVTDIMKRKDENAKTAFDQNYKNQQLGLERQKASSDQSYKDQQIALSKQSQATQQAKSQSSEIDKTVDNMVKYIDNTYVGGSDYNQQVADSKNSLLGVTPKRTNAISVQDKKDIETYTFNYGQSLANSGVPISQVKNVMDEVFARYNITPNR